MADEERYLSHFNDFQKSAAASDPDWLGALRRSAIDRFAELGFPTTRNEQWRFTRVRPIARGEFEHLHTYERNGLADSDPTRMTFDDTGCRRLVFVNGHFSRELSKPGKPTECAVFGSLSEAFKTHPEIVKQHLGQETNGESAFTALNMAYMRDGAFIRLPKRCIIGEPIHIVYVSSPGGKQVQSHPRTLVVAEEGSCAAIVESYIGGEDAVYFTNAVTEMVLGEGAAIDHYKLQRESRAAYHIATIQTRMGRDCRFDTDSISLGAALARNDINAVLDGEGIQCSMDGLYLADGRRHVDNHTAIRHAQPHCDSHELYKGILGGHASGVFNGTIHVDPRAVKTDAKQTNRCMLLSDDAQINTNPQLEIFADDVKCTHGASVGQLDENAVFYMRARGIEEARARHMLIFAFANEVLERVKVAPLRDRVAGDLFEWLAAVEPTETV